MNIPLTRVFWLLVLFCLTACAPAAEQAADESAQVPDFLFEDNSVPWDSPIGQSGAFSGGLFSRKPVLTVSYTAETQGELFPCDTCRGPSFGGLSRRVGLLNRLRTEPVPMLTIIGPNEFWTDQEIGQDDMFSMGEQSKNLVDAETIFAAYSAMQADAIYTSPKASAFFSAAGIELPDNFVQVGDEPAERIFDYGPYTVGVVFFAAPKKHSPEELDRVTKAALETGRVLRGQVDLLIGVSPWGTQVEKEFLPMAQEVFQMILGGGKGMGFPYAITENEMPVLWSRPDSGGRSLNVIRLYQWPEPAYWRWKAGLNFEGALSPMGANIPEDPYVSSILPPPSK